MQNIKNLIFDLDGTLYPYSQSMEDAEDKRSIDFISSVLSVDRAKAWKIINQNRQKGLFETDFLAQEYNISPQQYLEYVCDVDVSFILSNRHLAEKLSSIKQDKYIYTDSTLSHALSVLKQLEIDSLLFKEIYDAAVCQYTYKYAYQGFELFFQKSNLEPKQCMIFEDSLRNIKVAKSFGMKTVYICSQKTHIPEADYIFSDINTALDFLF